AAAIPALAHLLRTGRPRTRNVVAPLLFKIGRPSTVEVFREALLAEASRRRRRRILRLYATIPLLIVCVSALILRIVFRADTIWLTFAQLMLQLVPLLFLADVALASRRESLIALSGSPNA